MGLSVTWFHRLNSGGKRRIKGILESVASLASEHEFKYVGEPFDLDEEEIKAIYEDYEHELRWAVIQGGMHYREEISENRGRHYTIMPTKLMGVTLWPGEGCEQMNVLFGRYPGIIEVEIPEHDWWPDGPTITKRRQTGYGSKWLNESFCKTTYSAEPVKCHLMVCAILRRLESLVDRHEVDDEGEYYEDGDIDGLANEFEMDHRRIAALVGMFKDTAPDGADLVAPITELPDYERLEHEGALK